MSTSRLSVTGIVADCVEPVKKICDEPDVQFFLRSRGYHDITTFILQLNRALVPRKNEQGNIKTYTLSGKPSELPEIQKVGQVIASLRKLIAEAPPDTGPRRFGNVSFRKWHQLAEARIEQLLEEILSADIESAVPELRVYLIGSFGSPQRLDYGTGHELSFMAFLACLWKIDYFQTDSTNIDDMERDIVLYLFTAYLDLIRELIVTYNLEPAGSHGVWGLDDNSFLPYMFGSAQLNQPISETEPSAPTPISGSLPSSPDPSSVTKSGRVDEEAETNLYFGAIKFIYTVKRGPFWEHSPILFDISGIKDGWGKINKGLIKMYDAEVLAKFPVVQHFPFGSLLRWEKDPAAKTLPAATHPTNQQLEKTTVPNYSKAATSRPPPAGFVNGVTQAPWARSQANASFNVATSRMPLHSQASQPVVGGNRASTIFIQPTGNPSPAATKEEIELARKTAEPVLEMKEEETAQ